MIARRSLIANVAGLVAAPQIANAEDQLDRDTTGFPLDAAALDLLKWWTTPKGVQRAYLGDPGRQVHVRWAQPDRPRHRPLVLLHEGGLSGRVWDHALPLLAAARSVIAPDLPAHGTRMATPPSPSRVTPRQ